MHYTLISFDLDGTLVDTASEIAEAANRTLVAMGQARPFPKTGSHPSSAMAHTP